MNTISNKVVAYTVYSRDGNKATKVGDTTEVTLPEIEELTDTIKGAGILGEIDLPTLGQIGSLSAEISFRSTNKETINLLTTPQIELRWVTDAIDTSTGKAMTVANKAFLTVKRKKFSEGKLESGSAQDGSAEFEVLAYRRIMEGKEILNIDKLNNVYKINGIDQLTDITKNL